MRDTITTLRFSAGRSRQGPLTWGQLAILRELDWLADEAYSYNESVTVDIPPGTGLAAVLDSVRLLTQAHDGLRTTIERPGGGEEPAEPRQRVHASGEIRVRIVEGTQESAGSPDARHNFDAEREFPVRWTVYCRDGVPHQLRAVISHFTIDGTALRAFREELVEHLLARRDGGRSRGPAWHPLDQAEWERAEGAASSRAAVERWLSLIDEAPRQMFNARYPSTGAEDFHCFEMRSAAAAVALERISRRLNVSVSTIIVALTAVTVARLSGNRCVLFKVVVGNRTDERSRNHIAPLVQDGVVSLDTRGSFAEVIRRAWPASLRTYSRSRYHPGELESALAEYAARRGTDGDPRVALNDARFDSAWTRLPEPEDDMRLRALRESTTISHQFSQERVDVKFFVEVSGADDCLSMSLLTDATYIPSELIPDILRGMEELLLEEAAGSPVPDREATPRRGIPVLARGPEWEQVEGNWIHPAALRALLASIPGVRRAELLDPSAVRTVQGLRCRLFVDDTFDLDEPALKRFVADAARAHEDVLVPETFEIAVCGGYARRQYDANSRSPSSAR
ncbi:condensation domain-containing protein [Streptomyces sp. NBC_00365]|uniref:condensation domain-containing protein n=1 Tax=Streptomyces sp. NBC_00365 TaxID=2975726 RepID=UPI002251B1FD|nr:condensation domain-containing protein [Streptomyces sp. NBC_00365]MCX5088323.1 condensation domain-containing protein [Streptomyces sp. NBC_00365]